MVWQALAVILSFLLFPLILTFANHIFQQRREREASQHKADDDAVSRQKEACGDMQNGARQLRLAAGLKQALIDVGLPALLTATLDAASSSVAVSRAGTCAKPQGGDGITMCFAKHSMSPNV